MTDPRDVDDESEEVLNDGDAGNEQSAQQWPTQSVAPSARPGSSQRPDPESVEPAHAAGEEFDGHDDPASKLD